LLENIFHKSSFHSSGFEAHYADDVLSTPVQSKQGKQVTHELKNYIVNDASVRAGEGAFYDGDDNLIELSMYLLKKENLTPKDEIHHYLEKDRGMAFIAFNAGWRNYYHALTQGLFSAWLIKQFFSEEKGVFIFPVLFEGQQGWRMRYLELLDCTSELCTYHKNAVVKMPKAMLISSTYSDAYHPSPLLRNFGEHLIERSTSNHDTYQKIYVSRKDSSNRVMLNEDSVEDFFRELGYQILSLSGLTVDDQISIFSAAEKIIAPHGAGLSNIIFCSKDTKVLELGFEGYLNPCFVRIAQVINLDYHVHYSCGKLTSGRQQTSVWTCNLTNLPDWI